ncbi:RNA 3'-terminal phosphate cyclase [Candidatus Woesearchaeota archaeon]|nr:RNA 3'-terminal phosphate cyclase [Candidatus Woesearchaeota archaeon]
MIRLNGNYGEGGGQILRTALAISTLIQKPFEIYEIRKGRKDSGLKSQHLYGIRALKELCDAVAEGDEIGSLSLKYYPRKLVARNLDIDIETAGSVTLLLQALLLPSIFVSKPIKITVTGGTDVSWSPSLDYFSNVLLPQLQRFAKIEAKLMRRGYYPKGNGKVELRINPKLKLNDFPNFEDFLSSLRSNVNKIDLIEQCHLIKIHGISHASRNLQNAKVAERQAESAEQILRQKYGVPIKITAECQDTLSAGSGITLWAVFSKNKDDIDENNPIRLGADSLGKQGKKAEIVGEEAANQLISEIESKAPVDMHLADQILPYLALSGGSIKTSEITNHCKTNIYTIQQFFDDIFAIDEINRIISIKQ